MLISLLLFVLAAGGMSLFQVREWWHVTVGDGEEFDAGSMVVGNLDNEPSGAGEEAAVKGMEEEGETSRQGLCASKTSIVLILIAFVTSGASSAREYW